MTDKKGWGSTVVGWFVVQDDDPNAGAGETAQPQDTTSGTDTTADELIRKYAGGGSGSSYAGSTTSNASAAESSAGEASAGGFESSAGQMPQAGPGGRVDFEAVFEAAGVDAEERERVAKAVELLRNLPADTDKAVKKQIVETSLRAFGVPVDKIIEAGAEEIQALEFYIRSGANDTEQLVAESEQRIREYEEAIADIRRVMQERAQEQQAVIRACNEKKLEVQQILEFFGRERVAAVVQASPKLQDPSADEK